MKKIFPLIAICGSCCRGDLKIEYIKEGQKEPSFDMHVDFSAEDNSIESPKPPTLDTVIHKQMFSF